MSARVLKVIVQPVFAIEDADGDLNEFVGAAVEVPGKAWPSFAADAFSPDELAAVAEQWHAQQNEVAP